MQKQLSDDEIEKLFVSTGADGLLQRIHGRKWKKLKKTFSNKSKLFLIGVAQNPRLLDALEDFDLLLRKIASKMKIRVAAVFGSTGLFDISPPRYSLSHSRQIPFDELDLPPGLAIAFSHWIRFYEMARFKGIDEMQVALEDQVKVDRVGRKLAQELKDFLGGPYSVEYEKAFGNRSVDPIT